MGCAPRQGLHAALGIHLTLWLGLLFIFTLFHTREESETTEIPNRLPVGYPQLNASSCAIRPSASNSPFALQLVLSKNVNEY